MFRMLRTKLLINLTLFAGSVVGLGLWAIDRVSPARHLYRRHPRENTAARTGRRADKGRWAAGLGSSSSPSAARRSRRARTNLPIRPLFERNLEIEPLNVTLPGEQEMADALTALFARYLTLTDRFFALPPEQKSERTRLYFTQLLPKFKDIKREADAVLVINQKNMEDEDERARAAAAASIRLMVLALLGARGHGDRLDVAFDPQANPRGQRGMTGGNLDRWCPCRPRRLGSWPRRSMHGRTIASSELEDRRPGCYVLKLPRRRRSLQPGGGGRFGRAVGGQPRGGI
jgi:hypothetical protein